jgi:ABC-type antimicrobial peptide transport system permease subunit
VATLLTVVGVYGVLSFTVAQRTREIGIRMALGATHGAVRRAVISQALGLCAAGVTLGVVASVLLSGLLSSLLYEVAPTDLLTFIAVASLMLATGAAAAFVPSRRATRVDPMLALRAD